MKYVTKWSIKEENFPAALERFKNNPPTMPDGVPRHGGRPCDSEYPTFLTMKQWYTL